MKALHVLNLGAGVQSTALYLMFMRGEIQPQIDCAIFADTGDEPKAVYKHLEWLQSLNGAPILVRSRGNLGNDLIAGRGTRTSSAFMDIPVFTTHVSDNGGQTKRQCSSNYKIRVIEQTIRRDVLGLEPKRSPARGTVINQYMGISLDESGRAARIKRIKRPKYCKVHFPLIDHFMTRANCLTYLADKVPHETPRSACVFCPFHSDYEWDRQKREDPAGWARSLEIDAAIRKHDPTVFLHPSCVPLNLVQLDTRPDPRKAQLAINFSSECLGVCGV
jgi:hypothetical protein